jgi:hypothetical protein
MAGKRGNPNIREVNKQTRFQPGQSGNPGGRRPGLSITRLVRDELQKPTCEGSTITNAEMVAAMVVNLAKAGHPVFTPLVWRYVDGDPKQASEAALRELAETLAPKLGLDPRELLAEFLADMGAA